MFFNDFGQHKIFFDSLEIYHNPIKICILPAAGAENDIFVYISQFRLYLPGAQAFFGDFLHRLHFFTKFVVEEHFSEISQT